MVFSVKRGIIKMQTAYRVSINHYFNWITSGPQIKIMWQKLSNRSDIYIYMYKEDYMYLVFTQSVDSNFRAFWLAPVTRSIHGYSLFSERRGKWRVVSRKFQNKKLKKRFLSIWFGKYYNSYPPQGRWRTVDIYLDASRLGIYPPLFTSPSGDSCIILLF